jgi:hypothetical protein
VPQDLHRHSWADVKAAQQGRSRRRPGGLAVAAAPAPLRRLAIRAAWEVRPIAGKPTSKCRCSIQVQGRPPGGRELMCRSGQPFTRNYRDSTARLPSDYLVLAAVGIYIYCGGTARL